MNCFAVVCIYVCSNTKNMIYYCHRQHCQYILSDNTFVKNISCKRWTLALCYTFTKNLYNIFNYIYFIYLNHSHSFFKYLVTLFLDIHTHNYFWGRNDLGAKRLGSETTFGGETTRGETTWGRNDSGGETTWGRNDW